MTLPELGVDPDPDPTPHTGVGPAPDTGVGPDSYAGASPDPYAGAGPDPDPTPTASPWQEYLAAAQSLDAVLRGAAAERTAATRTASASVAELAQLRARLRRQHAWLLGESVRLGVTAPHLVPTPAEQAAAEAAVAGDPVAAAEALPRCRRLLDAVDAALAAAPTSPAPARPPAGLAHGWARGWVRAWWPPPLWLAIAIPLTTATLLLCVFGLLVFLTR